ncbi:TPA: type II secretion system protein [Vibrio parahaemolyticus]|uniref:type II secretion system protein n=1 Tax=Vibrio parahaemolyticus TaxID=670 RepID=UPI001121268C|nr:type II secretion system protein [Vibrio parahaemolyticus]EIZ1047124.1 type II secretion system protein [Vibrio parahaemolyticus]MDF4656165.1 type II secretion system protein [Vibrio parahaemolyticus]MDF4989461.1 type II secretion system protein [Vibrio parahaemolyticus]MDF5093230.1 type II secretion system protein [Vibrio parahaemolyticus]MDF5138376.1 type II secretion system protein [Vibrio parahaemolyticus]
MKRQGGFTLIELVVVIVILGILAVTAAPRFLNLQDDARKASLQGLKGAIDGAAGITYGKAAVEGKEAIDASKATAGSEPEVEGIKINFGYPTVDGLNTAVTGLTEDWTAFDIGSTPTAGTKYFKFKGKDSTGWTDTEGCFVKYTEATGKTAATAAKTKVVDTKC